MKVITIGRNSGNNVVVNDSLVSRMHCQIIQDDYGRFSLVDNNSANGTFVNGQRRQGQVSLDSNDIVRIGNSTLPWKSYFSGGTAGGGGGYQPPTSMPTTYLWQSIVVTILCCWPFGIPAIVNAAKVQKFWSAGDYARAQEASKKASSWSLVSLIVGIVVQMIFLIYYFVMIGVSLAM